MLALAQKTISDPEPEQIKCDRQKLLSNLLDAVKQCQVRFGGRKELATDSDSRVACLCSQFESVLQHGMKPMNKTLSALRQVTGITKVAGYSLDTKPIFWQFVKEFLNKHELERYMMLRHINSDVGRGRAWLRSSLNEHSLERYMHLMVNDASVISHFYEEWAFIMDEERSSMLPVMAAGLGSILFAISIDSEDLNGSRLPSPALSQDTALPWPSLKATPISPEPKAVVAVVANDPKKERKRKKKAPQQIVSFDDDSSSSIVSSSIASPRSLDSTHTFPPHSGCTAAIGNISDNQSVQVKPVSEKISSKLSAVTSQHVRSQSLPQHLLTSHISTVNTSTTEPRLPVSISSEPDEQQSDVNLICTPTTSDDHSFLSDDVKKCNLSLQLREIASPVDVPVETNLLPNTEQVNIETVVSDTNEVVDASLIQNQEERLEEPAAVEQQTGPYDDVDDDIYDNLPVTTTEDLSSDDSCPGLSSSTDETTENQKREGEGTKQAEKLTEVEHLPKMFHSHDVEPGKKIKQLASAKVIDQIKSSASSGTVPEARSGTTEAVKGSPSTTCTLTPVNDVSVGDLYQIPPDECHSEAESASVSSLDTGRGGQAIVTVSQMANTPGTATIAGSHRYSCPGMTSLISHETMTPAEMRQALVAMMLRREDMEEQNRSIRQLLEIEMETAATLRGELDEVQRKANEREEKTEARIKALKRENELLKQQLKKYIGAVQMLKRDGPQNDQTLSELIENIQPAIPPSTSQRDYSYEASQYESKLIQVAEMHGELVEFNEHLHRQLNQKDLQLRRLKEELVDLRGPLPEEGQTSDDDVSITSDYDTSSMTAAARALINIWIPSAFLRGKTSDAHHVYQVYVRIRDEEWNVYRRYAQFYELHSTVKRKLPIVNTFDFPPKKVIGNKELKFVEERRKKLQHYLRCLVNIVLQETPELAASPCQQTLIQTLPFFGEAIVPEPRAKTRSKRKFKLGRQQRDDAESSQGQQHYMGL